VRTAGAFAVVLLAVVLLRHALAGLDLGATLRAVRDTGRWAPFALLPFLATTALDAAAMSVLLATLGRSVTVARLLPIRIASEALHMTAPAGFVVADSANAALLESRCGVPLGEGAVLAVGRKWLVMRAHATYIVLGALCGSATLAAISLQLLGNRALPWAVAASALVPLGLSLAVGRQLRGTRSFERLRGWLGKLPWAFIRDRAVRSRRGAAALDAHLERIGGQRSATWLATAAYLGGWLFEAAETCLLVRLVGGPLDFGLAIAVEVGISLVRSMASVAPAGLGIQDAGYAVLLQAAGLPETTSAAFVLVKRGKEVAWIAMGYALLFTLRRPAWRRAHGHDGRGDAGPSGHPAGRGVVSWARGTSRLNRGAPGDPRRRPSSRGGRAGHPWSR
jgi:uncharacterized membrane protein YbhN (UPF0104 family)